MISLQRQGRVHAKLIQVRRLLVLIVFLLIYYRYAETACAL
nr:MAG TPA: hypothetical protein [Caudoviricetes sp.]